MILATAGFWTNFLYLSQWINEDLCLRQMAISTLRMSRHRTKAIILALYPVLLLQRVCSANLSRSFHYLNVSILFVTIWSCKVFCSWHTYNNEKNYPMWRLVGCSVRAKRAYTFWKYLSFLNFFNRDDLHRKSPLRWQSSSWLLLVQGMQRNWFIS